MLKMNNDGNYGHSCKFCIENVQGCIISFITDYLSCTCLSFTEMYVLFA